ADFLANELRSHGSTIIAERRTANHASVLFRCPIPPEEPDAELHLPDAFIRQTVRFEGPMKAYEARTVYNLPDFDRMSFRTALAFDLLRGASLSGSILLYGCGQGHLLLGLAQRAGKSSLSIADRDLLALEITRTNAAANGIALEGGVSVPTIASLSDAGLPGDFDWLVIDDDPTPGSLWNAEVAATADALLSDSGKLLLVSRSTSISRFEREMRSSFSQISDRRMHGFRASALRPRR
ncbi:MAG TPA: methyltransferase, partial [Spirochaetia bacterium]|nr:methyltransferase [Spirochaetia bacterium]